MVLLAGEFDLSIAGSVTFVGAFTTGLVSSGTLSPIPALATAILLGSVIGTFNGILVAAFKIPSLIATLAVATLLQGLTLWDTNGETIFKGLGPAFTSIGRWDIAGLQAPVIYAAAVAVALAIFLTPDTHRSLHAGGRWEPACRAPLGSARGSNCRSRVRYFWDLQWTSWLCAFRSERVGHTLCWRQSSASCFCCLFPRLGHVATRSIPCLWDGLRRIPDRGGSQRLRSPGSTFLYTAAV